MLELVKVGGWTDLQPRGAVIFVHGLGGHVYNTWAAESVLENFWPAWLVRDIPGLSAYTVQYPAAASTFMGAALSIYDRAKTILEELLVEDGLNNLPTIFVCHSMGGLIVKQLLQEADRRSQNGEQEVARLLSQIKAIAFIATPHLGSAQASLMTRLSFFIWPSEATQDLVSNDPSLRQLHQWYIQWPRSREIRHLEFQEGYDTFGFRIVPPAVPGLNTTPIPIDKNHIKACKPETKGTPPYRQVSRMIREVLDKWSGVVPQDAREASASIASFRKLSRDSAFLRSRAVRATVILCLLPLLAMLSPQAREMFRDWYEKNCYPYDPRTDSADPNSDKRECRPGQITYLKWIDRARYPGKLTELNVLPNDRPNRSLSFDHVDGNGNFLWTEKNLVRERDGKEYWNGPKGGWLEAGPILVGGVRGKLLRRGAIDQPASCLKAGEPNACNAGQGKICLIEAFIPDDLEERVMRKNYPEMCYRWTTFSCDGWYPIKIHGETDGEFTECVGPTVSATRD